MFCGSYFILFSLRRRRLTAPNRRVSILIQSPVTFLQIPHDHWYQPDWIDEARATDGRNKMVMKNIIYGGSVSYRNMCRFNSGVRLFSSLSCSSLRPFSSKPLSSPSLFALPHLSSRSVPPPSFRDADDPLNGTNMIR